MSTNSAIEWTDTTWNPVRGCSIVSKGCTNCYAMRQAHRFGNRFEERGGCEDEVRVLAVKADRHEAALRRCGHGGRLVRLGGRFR